MVDNVIDTVSICSKFPHLLKPNVNHTICYLANRRPFTILFRSNDQEPYNAADATTGENFKAPSGHIGFHLFYEQKACP